MADGTDRLYIKMDDLDAESFSQEIYKLVRPASLGDSGYVSTKFFEIKTNTLLSESVVAFDKDGDTIPIHANAITTTLATIFDSFVSDGYCTGTDKTNALSAINAAKGTTVSIATVFPATMWANRMNETNFDIWAAAEP